MKKINIGPGGRTGGLLAACLLLAHGLCACGNGGVGPKGAGEEVAREAEAARLRKAADESDPPLPGNGEPPAPDFQMRFDFARNLSQGHLRSGGLLIDFGTPARPKHTLGDWKSGFLSDRLEDNVTFSYMAANTAHLFFDAFASESSSGKIVIRARAHGSKAASVYLNGKYLGTIPFSEEGFSHGAVDARNNLRAGQNEIMLRCNEIARLPGGGGAAIALDYVRIVPESADQGPAAAAFDAVLLPDRTGGPDAIALAPGEAITYYLPIPREARVMGEVRARNDGEKGYLELFVIDGVAGERRLYGQEVGSRTGRMNVDLAAFAGRMGGIQLRASQAEVVIRNAGLFARGEATRKTSGKTRAKNLVLLLIDTLRADRLTAYNPDTRVRADALGRLAGESMLFARALAPENWTKPSVASLLSGLYPSSHKTQDDSASLPSTVVTLEEHLKSLGFATAGFVANGYVSEKFGFKRGWDAWRNYVREGRPNRAEFVAADVIEWLGARPKDAPFFLYVHTIDPHVPYIPPRKYWSLYDDAPYSGPVDPSGTAKLLERIKTGGIRLSDRDKVRLEALYDGEISYHDDQLARLDQAMRDLGLSDDTLLIVTSDHGEEFFEHGSVGHGHSLYEELLHVPLLVRLPGASAGGGARTDAEVSLVDVMPTACEILGVTCPPGLEGRSLFPLLAGREPPPYPTASFAEFLGGQRAVRIGRFKAIYRAYLPRVYDLEADPRESYDIAGENPVAVAALRDALGAHLGRFVRRPAQPGEAKALDHRPAKADLDPETKRQLKALGYLGGD